MGQKLNQITLSTKMVVDFDACQHNRGCEVGTIQNSMKTVDAIVERLELSNTFDGYNEVRSAYKTKIKYEAKIGRKYESF